MFLSTANFVEPKHRASAHRQLSNEVSTVMSRTEINHATTFWTFMIGRKYAFQDRSLTVWREIQNLLTFHFYWGRIRIRKAKISCSLFVVSGHSRWQSYPISGQASMEIGIDLQFRHPENTIFFTKVLAQNSQKIYRDFSNPLSFPSATEFHHIRKMRWQLMEASREELARFSFRRVWKVQCALLLFTLKLLMSMSVN